MKNKKKTLDGLVDNESGNWRFFNWLNSSWI